MKQQKLKWRFYYECAGIVESFLVFAKPNAARKTAEQFLCQLEKCQKEPCRLIKREHVEQYISVDDVYNACLELLNPVTAALVADCLLAAGWDSDLVGDIYEA